MGFFLFSKGFRSALKNSQCIGEWELGAFLKGTAARA